MVYQLLADLVLITHVEFVVMVVFGGFAVLRWPRLIWLHLPAVLWGAVIEFIGFVCPLTPLEVWLRSRNGGAAYEGDFIGHYITAFLYPDGLTRGLQVLLGFLALVPNVAIYGYRFVRRNGLTFGRHC
ncbi:MAG: hypothetical protein QOI59_5205 [Gammaproteobacteria bacterium]|nr:hypothetical protein [Gammaproteobacteria bacterium]